MSYLKFLRDQLQMSHIALFNGLISKIGFNFMLSFHILLIYCKL
jgi:hypothetical protein